MFFFVNWVMGSYINTKNKSRFKRADFFPWEKHLCLFFHFFILVIIFPLELFSLRIPFGGILAFIFPLKKLCKAFSYDSPLKKLELLEVFGYFFGRFLASFREVLRRFGGSFGEVLRGIFGYFRGKFGKFRGGF